MRNKGRLFILFLVSLLWLPACVNVPKFVPGELDADIDADLGAAGGPVDQGVEMGLDSARDVMDQSVQDAFTDTDVATISDEGVPSPLIQITASRDSGVAPLLVHFSVEAVGDAISQRDLYNAEYQWTLGDGALQETSYEPMAVQIYDFEAAGDAGENVITVEVSVTVTLPNDGGTLSASTTVSVEDPDEHFSGEKTVCYAQAINGADVDYEGCPDDALKPALSGRPFYEVFGRLAGLAGRRILFRRGQTFQLGTETIELTADGDNKPTHIGAFGPDGARPILEYSGTEYPLALDGANDVRIQSLAFELPSVADLQSNGPIPDVKPIVVRATSHQILIDDTRMLGIRSKSDSPRSNEGLEDSAITRSSIAPRLNDGANLSEINLKVDRFAFVRNQVIGRENVQGSDASHVNLVTGDSLLVRNNHWSARKGGQADSLLNLKLMPIDRCPPQTLITNNAFAAGEFHRIVELTPVGQYGNEPCEGEIRFERNHLTWRNNNPFECMGDCSRSMLTLGSTGAWILNNIFDFGSFSIEQMHLQYGVNSIGSTNEAGTNRILHNTFIVGNREDDGPALTDGAVYAVGLIANDTDNNTDNNAVMANNLLLALNVADQNAIAFSDHPPDDSDVLNPKHSESWPFQVDSLSSESGAEAYRLRAALTANYAGERLADVLYDFGGACRGAMTLPGAWAGPSERSDGGCTPQPSD